MKDKITEKNLKLLNKKKGLKLFLSRENISISRTLRYLRYENRLIQLQEELIKLQKWVKNNNEKIVFVFEGRCRSRFKAIRVILGFYFGVW